jgi:phosphonate transport system permease protein
VSTTLRSTALHDLAGLRVRHPAIFTANWRRRSLVVGAVALALALAAYAFYRLDFSFARLGSGLGQIAHMVSLMFPPSPGGRLPLYLQAMAETLAIALLGTLTAAVLAFPVGFLAAKNVVPNISPTLRCAACSTWCAASTC